MNQPAFPTWKRSDDMAEGMTLRDYFAAAVLQGMYANGAIVLHEDMAYEAYDIADVMMRERNK